MIKMSPFITTKSQGSMNSEKTPFKVIPWCTKKICFVLYKEEELVNNDVLVEEIEQVLNHEHNALRCGYAWHIHPELRLLSQWGYF